MMHTLATIMREWLQMFFAVGDAEDSYKNINVHMRAHTENRYAQVKVRYRSFVMINVNCQDLCGTCITYVFVTARIWEFDFMQCANIKFSVKLKKSATKTLEMVH